MDVGSICTESSLLVAATWSLLHVDVVELLPSSRKSNGSSAIDAQIVLEAGPGTEPGIFH